MHAEIKLILDLQHLDQRISELQKEIAALPRHVAVIEKALDNHNRRLEADRAALAANLKERKRLEGDVQVHEQKVSKLRGQMLDAKTNEQYKAFEHEIAYCEREIRKADDRALELMEQSEPLDRNVKAAVEALRLERAQVEAEKAEARERTAADQRELAAAQAEREKLIAQLSRPTLAAYQRIRKKWNGTVIAEAVEGRCGACYMSLRPQFFQDLKTGDQIMFCESCGRMLYYHPTVVVDAQAGGPVSDNVPPMPIRRL